MTKHYQGDGTYDVFFTSGKKVVLTEGELAELQEEQVDYVAELEEANERMNEKAYKLSKDLENISASLDKNVSSDDFDVQSFDYEQTQISEIIKKLEDLC